MYCLSQFCCFCFRNKIELKLLHKISYADTTLPNIVNDIIPEIQLLEISHGLSICEECVKHVTELHTFRQNCVRNNFLLVEYSKQLRLAGGDVGNVRIRMLDLLKTNIREDCSIINAAVKENMSSEELKLEECIKEEPEDLPEEDPLQGLGDHWEQKNCNEVGIKTETVEEEVKIEVNDDFNLECKKECNEELSDGSVESGNEDISTSTSSTKTNQIHPKGMHVCSVCGKIFTIRSQLRRHNLFHTGEKRHKCNSCGKTFSLAFQLRRHNLVHTGEKAHKCETCGKCFTELWKLREHNLIHTGEKPHKCETCGKCFTQSSTLKQHTLTHSGEKPYKCDECGKCFSLLCRLKQHLLTHTREKPYRCETCGKCFTHPSSLIQHNITHGGEKPHKCGICGKCFSHLCRLKEHNVTHTGEKPYRCDMCGSYFSQASSLRKHKKRHKLVDVKDEHPT